MKAVEARQGSLWQLLALIILFSVYIKYSVGLWGYSGFNTPPMHGDFEAQRHWMEVTTNLPLAEWYSFDLMYWGLDYPPLTAYVSCFFGWLARGVRLPELVALHASRGIETEHTKIFMRVSVIICDLVVFTPSVVLLAPLLQPELAAASPLAHSIFVLAGLLSPGLLLIDHGHFQYNCVAIGLTLLGARCILRDRDILGSVLFCLALNFKQTALYYSPVLFCVLLRKCVTKPSFASSARHLLKLSATVVLTFALLWAPFCVYHAPGTTCLASLAQVLRRLFPFSRGVFEDKVANAWYCLSVAYDVRAVYSIEQLASMSLALTLLLLLPTCVNLLTAPASAPRFMLALTASSLAFFLASFQVHEKSVLLSVVPAALLVVREPAIAVWMQTVGCFSMFPLLRRDGLAIPYVACVFFSATLVSLMQDMLVRTTVSSTNTLHLPRHTRTAVIALSYTGMVVLHLLEALVPPPPRYPDIYPALFSIFGACNLCTIYLLVLYWQFSLNSPVEDTKLE